MAVTALLVWVARGTPRFSGCCHGTSLIGSRSFLAEELSERVDPPRQLSPSGA